MHEADSLIHELNYILLLGYKLTLPEYNIKKTTFVGLKTESL
jgi:hypothetical protein